MSEKKAEKKSQSVLIIGANGYIGKATAKALRAAGHQVTGYVRNKSEATQLTAQGIAVIDGELNSAVLGRFDVVIDTVLDWTCATPRQIIKGLSATPGKRYIYTSGILVYGDHHGKDLEETVPPTNAGLQWRIDLEKEVVGDSKVQGVVLRPAYVYGDDFGKYAAGWFQHKGEIDVEGNFDRVYSWIHLEDLADAYVKVVEAPAAVVAGQIFDVADSTRASYGKVRELMAKAGGRDVKVNRVPAGEGWPSVANVSVFVTSNKLKTKLGWAPKYGPFDKIVEAQYKEFLTATSKAAKKSVLIIGGNGYIGKATAKALRNAGHQVTAYVRNKSEATQLTAEGIAAIDGELNAAVLGRFDVVIDTVMDWTCASHRQIIKDLSATPGKRYIYTSGILVYGDHHGKDLEETVAPTNPGLKWRIDLEKEILGDSKLQGVVLRPGYVYGYDFGKFAAGWFEHKGEIDVEGNYDRVYSWIFLDDLADAYVKVTEAPADVVAGQVFDVADSTRASYGQIRELMAKAGGRDVKVNRVAAGEGWPSVANVSVFVTSNKLKTKLGWEPKYGPFDKIVELQYKEYLAATGKIVKKFEGKVVVALGAYGVVGTGAVRSVLQRGGVVVAVGRDAKKLDDLKAVLDYGLAKNLTLVVGDFSDEKAAAQAKAAVDKVLQGKQIDHVLSFLGSGKLTEKGPSGTPASVVREAFDEGFYPNLFAAQAFIPAVKDREGASFSLASGGLAHFMAGDPYWVISLKNNAMNLLTQALVKEFEKAPVRVNCLCIHFAVAPIGGSKNHFGYKGVPNRDLGHAIAGYLLSDTKGKVLCIPGIDNELTKGFLALV